MGRCRCDPGRQRLALVERARGARAARRGSTLCRSTCPCTGHYARARPSTCRLRPGTRARLCLGPGPNSGPDPHTGTRPPTRRLYP